MVRLQDTFWCYSKAKCVALLLVVVLPACTQMSISVNNSEPQKPLNLTQTTYSRAQTEASTIDHSDKTVITETIESALIDKAKTESAFKPLGWANPESGNSGTILSLFSVDENSSITGCRDFVTSANTVGGVRAYQGRSCPDSQQRMRIVQLEPLHTTAPRTLTR